MVEAVVVVDAVVENEEEDVVVVAMETDPVTGLVTVALAVTVVVEDMPVKVDMVEATEQILTVKGAMVAAVAVVAAAGARTVDGVKVVMETDMDLVVPVVVWAEDLGKDTEEVTEEER